MSKSSVVWAFVSLPLGFFLGLATALIQAIDVDFFGLTVPIGIVLAVLAVVVSIRLVDRAMQSRYAGLALALGWLVATAAGSFRTTAGDVLLQGDSRTLAYFITCGVLGAAAVSWPVKKLAR